MSLFLLGNKSAKLTIQTICQIPNLIRGITTLQTVLGIDAGQRVRNDWFDSDGLVFLGRLHFDSDDFDVLLPCCQSSANGGAHDLIKDTEFFRLVNALPDSDGRLGKSC